MSLRTRQLHTPSCLHRTLTQSRRLPTRSIPCASVYQEQEKRTPKLGRGKSKATPSQQTPSPKRAEILEDNVPWYKRAYINVTGFPFPLGPLLSRRTIRYEVEEGCIWTFEQEQSLVGSQVNTTIRMTAVKLSSGGLLLYSPVAPTQECVELIQEIGCPVEYILLATFAYEHKIYCAPMSRKFPDAQVWTSPGQWSWPLSLPPQLFGIFPKGVLIDRDESVPWAADLEQRTYTGRVSNKFVGVGPFSEVALYHKKSRTVMVTDAVVYIPSMPPQVINEKALMSVGGPLPGAVVIFSKGEGGKSLDENGKQPPPPEDPFQRLALGWRRMALQVLFFVPHDLVNPNESFREISNKLLVSPVLRVLVYPKAVEEGRRWVNSIVDEWDFRQIIPAHFAAPIPATPEDLRLAFSFLYEGEDVKDVPKREADGFLQKLFQRVRRTKSVARTGMEYDPRDLRVLNGLDSILKKTKVVNS
ncbi:hypothetical protein WJX74_008268 [Apatococcus lobatus]|uniref:Uncharacterized protein n=2 Tax=Apatococcus TaxID=904362 RepID=A0AAW1SQU6_9CHLO